jgi:hypothetical protein
MNCSAAAGLFAENIILKSGQVIEGVVLASTDQYVKIDFEGSPVTFFIDEIESVDGVAVVVPDHGQPETPSEGPPDVEPESRPEDPAVPQTAGDPPQNGEMLMGPGSNVVPIQEETEYQDALREFLKAGFALNADVPLSREEYNHIVGKLEGFRQKYPQSPLSEEAYYMPLFITALGCVMGKEVSSCEDSLAAMDIFAQQHPDVGLSDLSRKVFQEETGTSARGIMYIPYRYISDFLRGSQVFKSNDHAAAIKYFSPLVDRLDFNIPAKDDLMSSVYAPLAMSYFHLKRQDDLKGLFKSITAKCPDCHQGKAFIQELIDKQQ